MWKKTKKEIDECIKILKKLQKKTEVVENYVYLENAILVLKEMKGE